MTVSHTVTVYINHFFVIIIGFMIKTTTRHRNDFHRSAIIKINFVKNARCAVILTLFCTLFIYFFETFKKNRNAPLKYKRPNENFSSMT